MMRLVSLLLVLVFSLPGMSCALDFTIRDTGIPGGMTGRPRAGAWSSLPAAILNLGTVKNLEAERHAGLDGLQHAVTFRDSGYPGQSRRVDYMSDSPRGSSVLEEDSPRVADPATLLLIGSGLLGLACLPRRFER